MDVMAWARLLLEGVSLQDKLTTIPLTAPLGAWAPYALPPTPGRGGKLAFSQERLKFPKGPQLGTPQGRSIAIHSFANHELLAIEMMAAALLIYPHREDDPASIRMKRGLVSTIRDEQKHLGLYLQRLKDDGVEFGDYPLNDFFWRQMEKLPTPASFFALMSLTFESANLDFSLLYEKAFRELGDARTADLLRVVYEDEVTHVAHGAHCLGQWRGEKSLWDYYREVLPFPLTPARAKGAAYLPETRIAAGLDQDWVQRLGEFKDEFRVVNRRSWNHS
jgi:uncharacterized ferritin-like protein (DUF455 family)